MLDVIEKLLILQDRDRKLRRVSGELGHLEPERKVLQNKAEAAQAALEAARENVKRTETGRKALELEVQTRKQQIERYANQQLQTRKNEEYRALAQQIETCKAEIFEIENREIGLMEQAESGQKRVAELTQSAKEIRALVEHQLGQLTEREGALKADLAELESNRAQLAEAVDEAARNRYERLLRSKGEKVVVGVQHGVCGGCHMRLPAQILVSCQAQQELITCTNCGRILYYTRDMDLAVAE